MMQVLFENIFMSDRYVKSRSSSLHIEFEGVKTRLILIFYKNVNRYYRPL